MTTPKTKLLTIYLLSHVTLAILFFSIMRIPQFNPVAISLSGNDTRALGRQIQAQLGAARQKSPFSDRECWVEITFHGVTDAYHLARLMQKVRIQAVGGDGQARQRIEPRLQHYYNRLESRQTGQALLYLPLQSGSYQVSARLGDVSADLGRVTVTVEPGRLPLYLQKHFPQVVLAVALVLILAAALIEVLGSANSQELANLAFWRLLLAGVWAGLTNLASWPFLGLFLLSLAPHPWLARPAAWLGRRLSWARQEPQPSLVRELILWAAVGVSLACFAYSIWALDSFRWSIFEERDFLMASMVRDQHLFPLLGPQLLAGGNTPGGFLYLLLAGVLWGGGGPPVLALFTKLLHMGAALLFFLTLWRTWSLAAAAAALPLFCSSQVMVAYAYWPIHPSMSIFFQLLLVACLVTAFRRGSKGWLLGAALVLTLLVQLHFSYHLLVPALFILIWFWPHGGRLKLALASLGIWLVLLLPYLIWEVQNQGPNISAILAHPRFHPAYVAQAWLTPDRILEVTRRWLAASDLAPGLVSGLVGMALVLSLLALVRRGIQGAGQAAPTQGFHQGALLLVFALPFLCLGLSGFGYNVRHTISYGPTMFVILGAGAGLLASRKGVLGWIAPALAMAFTALLVVNVVATPRVERLSRAAGEWAVDYNQRQAVLDKMCGQFGLSPAQYGSRVYWWWLGWSADPRVYTRQIPAQGCRGSGLADGQYLLALSDPPLPVFKRWFDLPAQGTQVGPMTLWPAQAKPGRGLLGPSPNTVNPCFLGPLAACLENLRLPPGVLGRVSLAGREVMPGAQGYLLALPGTTMRLLLSLRQSGDRLEYRLDSPSLGGFYQEIKTVLRPCLLLGDASGRVTQRALLVDAALGSLLFKTPLSGSLELGGRRVLGLGLEGYFDQSRMATPQMGEQDWRLDQAQDLGALRPSLADAGWWGGL